MYGERNGNYRRYPNKASENGINQKKYPTMNSKTYIIDKVRKNRPSEGILPELPEFVSDNSDLVSMFKEQLQFVGGTMLELKKRQSIEACIAKVYPSEKSRWSNVKGVSSLNISMDVITDSHELKDVDLVVLKGAFGVAENAAIWIPSNTLQYRVLPFITQHLVIVLDKSDIVLNMHQAYQKLDIQSANGFGVFISGPSKTADIEQSLVIGAHGSRSLLVVFM